MNGSLSKLTLAECRCIFEQAKLEADSVGGEGLAKWRAFRRWKNEILLPMTPEEFELCKRAGLILNDGRLSRAACVLL